MKKHLVYILVGLFMVGVSGQAWGGATATDLVCNGCVNGTDIAASAVMESKVAVGAVPNGKIADGAITDSKIADGAVTDAKIMGLISPNKIGVSQAAAVWNLGTQALDNGEHPLLLNSVLYRTDNEGIAHYIDYGGLVVTDPVSGNKSIKIKESGLYILYVWLDFGTIPTDKQVGYRMYINGAIGDWFNQNGIGGGLPTQIYTSLFIPLIAGDEFTLYGYQNTGGPITMNPWAQFGVVKISNMQ